MKQLILLRGLPGSGKSTLAKIISEAHYEADMFFIRDDEYKFDPKKIKMAHEGCRDLTMMAMLREEPKIVISNTFTQEWEMMPYFALAKEYGYTVHTIIVENRHGGLNTHGCPKETIDKMKVRFEVSL